MYKMTIIYYQTTDLFELAPIADYIVNPTNLLGDMTYGINAEFVKRFPDLKKQYNKDVANGKLYVGTLQQVMSKSEPYVGLNVPTKNHPGDSSDNTLLEKAYSAIRNFLKDKGQVHIVIPILGHTPDGAYTSGIKLMKTFFHSIEAIVHICILPNKIKRNLFYLGILCPTVKHQLESDFFNTQSNIIKKFVNTSIEEWGLKDTDSFMSVLTQAASEPYGSVVHTALGFIADATNVVEIKLASTKRSLPTLHRGLQFIMSCTHLILIDNGEAPTLSMYKTLEMTKRHKHLKVKTLLSEEAYKNIHENNTKIL